MMVRARQRPASAKRRRSSAVPGAGRAFLVFSLAYLLLLGQLPLIPLLTQVLHGEGHPHCSGTVCYCKPGCQHDHHRADAAPAHKPMTHDHGDHAAAMHDAAAPTPPASLHTCGDEDPGLVTLILNKVFFPEATSLLPRPQPPFLLVPHQGSAPSHPVEDVFHPPRLG